MFEGPLATAADRRRAWLDSLFVDHAIFRLPWTNLAPVVPGKIYRCNHPTPARLARLKQRLGLKTLVNLRGHRRCGSDALSRHAAQQIGLFHIDMAFESRGAPHRDRILKFYDIYRTLQTPMLMHCKSGADRAGLASGLVVMFEGGTAKEALNQLHWRFGHFNRSRTGILDAFFLRFQSQAEGRIGFMDWVRDEYDEAALKRDFVAGKLASFLTDQVLRRE
ncbi:tyrosine-protein phosphatase [Kozakia baliensis]|uniref:tyrosine-protein phosphatase n=1 Tax=Kozakia baliensis TaxID=153496 RepID=UPI000496C2A8|nr:tyrosine-protein phosphatase [Kozakia baliensis]AOX20528.1 protein tyrosine phosphatase [Kozakia baliensis]